MADENIRIILTAVDKTRSGLSSVSRGLKSVVGAIFSMKSALASLLGAAGIGLMVKQSLAATDALAKTAAKIGTTTESLSRLQYAASLSGLSIEQTNMALQRFVRRTAEAAQGTGEAQVALRELGLDASKLSKQPLHIAMMNLADAFGNVDDGAQRLRIAFKLFDSEGAAFVNLLTAGSAGLVDMYVNAQLVGAVMSGSVARAVEKTNDAFTRLGFLFKGVRDQIVGALAPAMEELVTRFTDFFINLAQSEGGVKKWAETFAKTVLNTVAAVVSGMGIAIEKVIGFANALIAVINGIGSFFSDTFKEIPEISFKISEGFKLAAEEIQAFSDAIGAANGMVITIGSGADQSAVRFKALADAIGGALDKVPDISVAMENFATGAMSSVTDALTAAVTGAASFASAVKDMAKSIIDSLIKMLIQYYITKPLFDAISGYLGAPVSGGAAAPPVGKAIGGSVQAGTPYMVGERGAEMFIPNQSGSIVPNKSLSGGGGGVTVNQVINVSTGVAQTVRAEIVNLMPQIAQNAKAAVADARMRGGSYSKALVGA